MLLILNMQVSGEIMFSIAREMTKMTDTGPTD